MLSNLKKIIKLQLHLAIAKKVTQVTGACHNLTDVLTRGIACVGKCFERKISKPTKLDCKQKFYCIVYYITLNSNCEAQ